MSPMMTLGYPCLLIRKVFAQASCTLLSNHRFETSDLLGPEMVSNPEDAEIEYDCNEIERGLLIVVVSGSFTGSAVTAEAHGLIRKLVVFGPNSSPRTSPKPEW